MMWLSFCLAVVLISVLYGIACLIAGVVDNHNARKIVPRVDRPPAFDVDDDLWLAEQEELINEGRKL
jgi:hypothetical protein